MGADIHAVLQKKDKQGVFKTIDTGVIPCRDYDFFSWLSGVRGSDDPVAHYGFPDDFGVDNNNNHQGYFMGDHSFGYITLEEFCEVEVPEPPQISDKFVVEQHSDGYTVTFLEPDEIGDRFYTVRVLQTAFQALYGTTFTYVDENGDKVMDGLGCYRLVVGYDS